MASINRVTLAGNLGKDPETKSFSNGGSICTFSIATSEKWKDKGTGQQKERTDWHNIICNGKTGEIAQQYLSKGSSVLIEGSIRNRKYEKDGQTRYVTEIQCDRLHFLGGKSDSSQASRPAPAATASDDDDLNIPF